MALGGNRALGGRQADGREGSDPARPGNTESSRARLIEAAADLFAERGYERTSLQDIASRAGLTTGAIYSNFRGKREVLLAAIAQPAEAMGGAVIEARKAGASALDVIGAGARRLISGRGGRGRSILVHALVLASRDAIVGQKLRKGLGRTFREFGKLVEAGKVEGSIDPGVDTDAYTHYAYALTFGTYLLETAGVPPPDEGQWDRLMARLLAALSGSSSDGRVGAVTKGRS